MKLETGKPTFDGRYVVYVAGVLGWLEPRLSTWNKGAWYFYHSTEKFPDHVHYWIGPLPVVGAMPGPSDEFGQEFDL